MNKFLIIFVLQLFLRIQFCCATDFYLSNLNSSCMRCLCEGVTNCDLTRGCANEYCGPFYLSRIYWADAGKITFPDDSPDRENAFSDCARDYKCSGRIITNYMTKYAKDCNGDGVVDCTDYALIHMFGGPGCATKKFGDVTYGREFYRRYSNCKIN